ncbi:MAG: hypothetical protein L6R43_18055, partial [Planctomycetes bacterium]|nr:hypothetical protein [Planctomycetota bacterium]
MRTCRTPAALLAALALGCGGSTLLPPEGNSPLPPKERPAAAAAAATPRPVSREVVFAPEIPPALRPAPRPGEGEVILLGGGVRSVGAPEEEPVLDDGSWLPPVPAPPGVVPAAEEIPEDFLPAFAPAEEPLPEESPEEWIGEEPPVEVVEVAYYEVIEVPIETTVAFGTPVLVVDGYNCWGWGRFPAFSSHRGYDPCAFPRGGAWWESAYDPCWNPCFDPCWGSWDAWDRDCRPDQVYLDRDGDSRHGGHCSHGGHGEAAGDGHDRRGGGGDRADRGGRGRDRDGRGDRAGDRGGSAAPIAYAGERTVTPAAPAM